MNHKQGTLTNPNARKFWMPTVTDPKNDGGVFDLYVRESKNDPWYSLQKDIFGKSAAEAARDSWRFHQSGELKLVRQGEKP